jgi:hypothetical protein
MNLVQQIEQSVPDVELDTPREQILEWLNLLDCLAAATKAVKERTTDGIVAWIKANGPIESNGVRWYVGPKKVTKCVDKAGTYNALLSHFGGDMEAVSQYFASEPYKHGAISKELPAEDYARLFRVTVEDELKEGKPNLRKVDEKFLR